MYYDYFGLKQPPFKITPDTKLFYPGGNRGAILDALVYAITNGEGIVKVVGEVGSGKTMLCRMLEKELPDSVEIVYLANPSIPPDQILHAIAYELHLGVTSGTPQLQVTTHLQDYLVNKHRNNQQVVVFVEEAQAMPLETLEQIRLLSNLETTTNKLLQIVLFGQPELDTRIATPEIRQLKERITYSFQLNPFETNDVRDYLNSRLRTCGYRAGELFSAPAIKEIQKHSNGLLRRINILADKSLLAAYAESKNEIHASHVRQAARDSEFTSKRTFPWYPVAAGVAAITLAVILVLAFLPGTKLAPQLSQEPDMATGSSLSSEESVTTTAVTAQETDPVIISQSLEEAPQELTETGLESPEQTDNMISEQEVMKETVELEVTAEEMSLASSQPVADETSPLTEIESGTSETDVTLPANEEPTVTDVAPQSLLSLESMYVLQDFGDARLSSEESARLQKQLLEHPPEMVKYDNMSPDDDKCQLCWSIIYRPLNIPENL